MCIIILVLDVIWKKVIIIRVMEQLEHGLKVELNTTLIVASPV